MPVCTDTHSHVVIKPANFFKWSTCDSAKQVIALMWVMGSHFSIPDCLIWRIFSMEAYQEQLLYTTVQRTNTWCHQNTHRNGKLMSDKWECNQLQEFPYFPSTCSNQAQTALLWENGWRRWKSLAIYSLLFSTKCNTDNDNIYSYVKNGCLASRSTECLSCSFGERSVSWGSKRDQNRAANISLNFDIAHKVDVLVVHGVF